MTIAEMLKEAQYSRITVGHRWLIWTSAGWEVLERKRYANKTKIIITTQNEEEAVLHLLAGENDLYSDIIEKAKNFKK